MTRRELIVAAFSTAKGELHTPVQAQKLFFLIDKNVSTLTGGPHFAFQPYSYGPFDRQVYEELEAMARDGLVEIVPDRTWRSYRLTPEGQAEGDRVFRGLPGPVQAYLQRASAFVRTCSFTELVSAIYKAYPDMKKNSVFQEAS